MVQGLSPGKFCHMAYVGAERAETGRRETWGPWTGSAACLCLLVGSVIPLNLSFSGYKMGKIKLASSWSSPGGSIVKIKGSNWYENALSSIDEKLYIIPVYY